MRVTGPRRVVLVKSQCPCLEWPELDNNLGTNPDGSNYLEVRPQGRNGPVHRQPVAAMFPYTQLLRARSRLYYADFSN